MIRLALVVLLAAAGVPADLALQGPSAIPSVEELAADCESLAEESGRIRVETLGRTEEGRPLQLVILGRADRLAELDRLSALSRRFDRAEGDELEAVLEDLVPFVHVLGGLPQERYPPEPRPADLSSPRNLVLELRRLADEQTPLTTDAVWLVQPVADPDAYERYRKWYLRQPEQTRNEPGAAPDPGPRPTLRHPGGDPMQSLAAGRALGEVWRRYRPLDVRRAPSGPETILPLFRSVPAPAAVRQGLEKTRLSSAEGRAYPPHPDDPGRLADLARVLLGRAEPVYRLRSSWTSRGGHRFPAGSLVRPLEGLDLVRHLLASDLPDPYGARTDGFADRLGVRGLPVTPPRKLLEPVTDADEFLPSGRVLGAGDVYLLPAGDPEQHAAVGTALNGITGRRSVEVAEEAFWVGGRRYPAGTLWVRAPHSAVEGVARDLRIDFEAPGSLPEVTRHAVGLPRLAVLRPGEATATGWLRLALDRAGVSHDLLTAGDLAGAMAGEDLGARYDVIVLPSAAGDEWTSDRGWRDLHPARGDEAFSALEIFAQGGGLVVALGDAVRPWLAPEVSPSLRYALPVASGLAALRVDAPRHPIGYGFDGDGFLATSSRVPYLSVRPQAVEAPEVSPGLVRFVEVDEALAEVVEQGGPLPPFTGRAAHRWFLSTGGLSSHPLFSRRPPAVVEAPVGEGRVFLFAFDPFLQDVDRRAAGLVWNILLHWNHLP